MLVSGTIAGMQVASTGKVAIAQRDAGLRLHIVSVLKHEPLRFDIDKSAVIYNNKFSQNFSEVRDN